MHYKFEQMRLGTVLRYDRRTGGGTIAPKDGGRALPLGDRAVREAGLGQLTVNQIVGFRTVGAREKPIAVDLTAVWSNR
jgi:cold shock CspA family protein